MIGPFKQGKDIAELMREVNLNSVAPIEHLFWYASTNKNITPMCNTAISMLCTGPKDMNKFFGPLYLFYEAFRNRYNDLAMLKGKSK